MAYLNIRMLLCFLGLILVLNITQLALSSKRRFKISRYDLQVDDQDKDTSFVETQPREDGAKNRIFELLRSKSDSLRKTAKTDAPSSTFDSETCLNTDVTHDDNDEQKVELCPEIPPDLGPDFQSPTEPDWVSDLLAGGYFQNKKCKARESIAIIVPHSGPKKNLIKFLHHMHPFLMKQQAEYQIFVIDHANKSSPLTHGYLFNVGFQEALKHRNWDCLIFHEHHLVPLDSRNLYRCNWYPKLLVAEIQTEKNDDDKIYQPTTLGGVVALRPKQFSKINGFSNLVPGRDEAYLELFKRVQVVNYSLERNEPVIGQYKTLAGPFYATAAEKEYNSTNAIAYTLDGLSTLSYEVRHLVYQSLFTYIRVNKSEESASKPTTVKLPFRVQLLSSYH